ncbi:MAG: UDP-N-acetylmuramoyl-L-alanyl-D-glutamate--2,6-diaminopimelate ligase [Polyangia bacterium]
MKSLAELLRDVEVLSGDAASTRLIAQVCDDSRMVGPGDLFVAVRGLTVDGHDFVATARERGAAMVVVERDVGGDCIVVPDAAKALGRIAANRHDRPADAMTLIGVTGTNGKTTITYLVEALLLAARQRPGVIGTVEYRSPRGSRPSPFTTPTPLLLQALLAEMRDEGCTHVVMECSSHALASGRLEAVDFAVAAFTNLTQDHLDFHGTMEAYACAKARLFSEHLRRDGIAVVNLESSESERMARAARGRVIRVGGAGDVRVESRVDDPGGMALRLATERGPLSFHSPLVGGFNVENLLVAAGIGIALGLSSDVIAMALSSAIGAPGRLQRVGSSPACYVDYAHTPDALERALAALRPTTRGKLWVVFGCGGDRDRGKRPIMGRIAEDGADRVLVTSDNPRTEDPHAVLAQIVGGMRSAPFAVLEPRRAAIFAAVGAMAPEDTLLVAGKGHEDYQIVGTEKHHFDDREEVRAALQRRG